MDIQKLNNLQEYQRLCQRTANKNDDPEKEIMGLKGNLLPLSGNFMQSIVAKRNALP